MNRLDIIWTLRHPWRWARAVWWQLTIAAVLATKAVLITDPLWEVTTWSHIGPLTIVAAAAVCLASAVAPAERRLQSFCAWTLGAVAVWRTATYGMLIFATTDPTTTILAEAFTLHWVFIGFVATQWPVIALKSELEVTVESGQESLRAAS